MTYVVTQACVDVMDRSCVEQCPVDCDLTPKLEPFLDINARFFDEIGSPAGARKFAQPGRDPEFVSNLPRGGRP